MTAKAEDTISHIGKYEVVRLIGSGGGGVVYEAIHPELKKRVAVKTLHPKLAQNPEARRRFLREGEAASRIRHPHVVDVTDVGVHGDQPFLVMELLEGRDLKAYLVERGALSLVETVDLMLPVIGAVGAGHDAGVVHRDLKPHNVFLGSARGVGLHPKVLDFGVSKLLDSTPGSISWSGAEVMMGTLCYMAPEQVRGSRHLDARVDQYALGLITYECLTGRRVHEGEDQVAIIRKISEGHIEPPSTHRPELPPGFEDALMQALSTNPDERFPNVYEFGRALLPFAGHRVRMLWKSVFEGAPTTERRPVAGATTYPDEMSIHIERRPRTAPMQPQALDEAKDRRRRFLIRLSLATLPVLFGAGIAALVSQWRQPPEVTTPTPTPEETDPAATRGRASIEQLPPQPTPSAPPADPSAATADPSTATADPSTAAPAARPSPSPTQADEVADPDPDPTPDRPPTPPRKPTPRKDPAASKPTTAPTYELGANQAPIITD